MSSHDSLQNLLNYSPGGVLVPTQKISRCFMNNSGTLNDLKNSFPVNFKQQENGIEKPHHLDEVAEKAGQ